MIPDLPNWINILFLISWLFTIVIFALSNPNLRGVLIGLIVWSSIQSVLAFEAFYQITNSIPPRFALVLIPSAIWLIWEFTTLNKRRVISQRNLNISPFLHMVRLPMEIVLWQLYIHGTIPELMTFEGRNFDIVMGITAPVIGWLYIKGNLSLKVLRIWNVVGLILILFIMTNGILSAELPIQMFALDQPNKALTYFPFVLLPSIIVPLVIYTHVTDLIKINRLLKQH